MIVFPHAKINLGLNVLHKRDDGFHDIESVLVPIPLTDVLEAVVDASVPDGAVEFTSSGTSIPGSPSSNLCIQAVAALRSLRPMLGIRMHLHKVIPTGAGLGGGSSDGTHALMLLNSLLKLEVEGRDLHNLASGLGSDCPFFLSDRPQLAEGRGERLIPVEVALKGWWLLLVNPGIHVGTQEVYGNTKPSNISANIADTLVNSAPDQWQSSVKNCMEEYVFDAYPVVKQLRDALKGNGAAYAAMSGSGSSVFGLFKDEPALPVAWTELPMRAWKMLL